MLGLYYALLVASSILVPYLEKADFPAIFAYASQTGRGSKARCR